METQRSQAIARRRPRAARTAPRPVVRTGDPVPDGALWGVVEVGSYLGISYHAIYRMTGRKAAVHIPHIRIGGKLRFRKADVDRWLTLLTVSNLETLSKMRQKASQVNHANHPQAEAP